MNILHLQSSSKKTNSISKLFGQKVLDQLKRKHSEVAIKERHTTYSNLPYIDEAILNALFVKGERTEAQKEALGLSQKLVEELFWTDTLIISSPIYNFSVPASLKAYFDLVARAGLTFRYTKNGPIGLLEEKKAYVVLSSGGTKVGSDIDFAGRYIKHFLGFIGITDIEQINLDQLMMYSEDRQKQALAQISAI